MGDSLQIRSLVGVDPEILVRVFNDAFADYIITFQASREFLEFRWALARVDWDLSLGAFDGERLVGFCWHGVDELDGRSVAYNSGTGVLPDYRGNGLVDRIYHETWPLLRARGIGRCTLEVIAGNDRAVRVYERIGFTSERELVYVKGELDFSRLKAHAAEVELRELRDPPWAELETIEEMIPAWDFMLNGAKVQGEGVRVVGAYDGDHLLGAAILRDSDHTLCWLSVAEESRRKGVASALLTQANEGESAWRMVNVDRRATHLLGFLDRAGLKEEMFQYEMAAPVPAS